MAINPFPRITPLDVPQAYPSAARIDPSTFSNLASIGEAIGNVRERQAMADIMRSATDASGNLDLQKAATAVALSGRDPARLLTLLEAQQRAQEAAAYRKESLDIARQGRDIQQKTLERPDVHYLPPSLMTPGGVVTVPRTGGGVGTPSFQPYPPATPPPIPPATPGPQSELEMPGAARPALAAAAAPGEQLPLPFYPRPDQPETPSEGPPYQVAQAGPLTLAPTAKPAAAPAEKSARNEAVLQRLPPAAQTIVKGIAEYEIDPATLSGQDREQAVAAAKAYRPDYSMSEYQKRGTPPSGEVASRIGLAKAFIARTDTIRERIQADELNSAQGRALAMVGQGGPGELRRAIDEGSEALLRGLTGAGMSANEATNYARRYQFSLIDTKETQLRKVNELENALRYVTTEVGKGRGGEDIVKGFTSKFGEEVVAGGTKAPAKVTNDAEANKLIGSARNALKRDPGARNEIIKRLRERGVPNPEMLLGQ